jgi:hypothetical protein
MILLSKFKCIFVHSPRCTVLVNKMHVKNSHTNCTVTLDKGNKNTFQTANMQDSNVKIKDIFFKLII